MLKSNRKYMFLHCKYLAAARMKMKIHGKHGDLKKWCKKLGLSRREVERRAAVGLIFKDLKCDHVVAFPLSNLKRIVTLPAPVAKAIVKQQRRLSCAELDVLSVNLRKAPYEQMPSDQVEAAIEKTLSVRNSEIKAAQKEKSDKKEKRRQLAPGRQLCERFERKANAYLEELKQLKETLNEIETCAYESELSITKYLECNSAFNKTSFVKEVKSQVSEFVRLLEEGGYDGSSEYLEATSRNGRTTSYFHS